MQPWLPHIPCEAEAPQQFYATTRNRQHVGIACGNENLRQVEI